MIVIPAIDLRGGRCVRLVQGRFDDETVFSDDPVAVARQWQDAGAQLIHVVDLDGARKGVPQHFEVIERKVSAHPEVKDTLSISILFANQADFAQPAPGVTLSLFNNQQQLIARRSFSYKEYMDHASRKAPMFEPGQTQSFFLNLEDPGSDVTGFEFRFF